MRDQIVIGDLADEIWGKGEILNQKTSGRTMSAIYEAYSYEAVAEYVLKQSQSREEMKEKLRALEIGTRGSPELEVAFDPDWVSCLPP